jgi:hypothetical protein
LPDPGPLFGPSAQLPSMKPPTDVQHFRRVQIRQTSEPIRDIQTAEGILRTDLSDAAANTYVALELLQEADRTLNDELLAIAKRHLEISISSGIWLDSP